MNREGKYICSFILVFFKNKRFKIFLLARSEQVASSVNMQRLQIPLRETCWYAFYGKAVKAIEQWMHAHTHSFGNVLGYTSGSPTSIGHELQQGRPYRLEAGWVIDRDQTQINLCVCVCTYMQGWAGVQCVRLLASSRQSDGPLSFPSVVTRPAPNHPLVRYWVHSHTWTGTREKPHSQVEEIYRGAESQDESLLPTQDALSERRGEKSVMLGIQYWETLRPCTWGAFLQGFGNWGSIYWHTLTFWGFEVSTILVKYSK